MLTTAGKKSCDAVAAAAASAAVGILRVVNANHCTALHCSENVQSPAPPGKQSVSAVNHNHAS